MKPVRTLSLGGSTVFMRFISGGHLAVINNRGEFRIINIQLFKQISAFKSTAAKSDSLNKTTLISKTGKTAIFVDQETYKLRLVNIQAKKILGQFNRHQGYISCIALDNDDLYLATGGEDGHVHLHSAENGKFIMKLPSHPDFISHLGFSFDGSYLISCGYDGSMVITNLSTHIRSSRMRAFEHNKISAMLFLPDFIVALGNNKGELVFINYLKQKVIKRINLVGQQEITGLMRGFEGRMLFVSQKDSRLSLISLEDFEIMGENLTVLTEEINAMGTLLRENLIVLGTDRGNLLFYEVHESKDLKELIDAEKYPEAYEMVLQSPLLLASGEYERLEGIWEQRFDAALKLLCKHEPETAYSILEPFAQTTQKAAMINKLKNEFKGYDKLEKNINDGNLLAAYSQAQNTMYLKKSIIFLQLENQWKKDYKQALEAMLVHNRPDLASKTLEKYTRIPAKATIVHNMLRNPSVYYDLINCLKEKDFKKFFQLVHKYKFLRGTPEYKNVMEYAEHSLGTVKHHMENRKYTEALEVIRQISHFVHLREQLVEFQDFAKTSKNFLNTYEVSDTLGCYEMIDNYPFLNDFEEAKKLEQEWRELIREGENRAHERDAKGVIELFHPFLDLSQRNKKIGLLLQRAYQNQLLHAMEDDSTDPNALKHGIKRYIAIFGLHEDILDIIETIQEKFQIDLEINEREKDKEVDWYAFTRGNIPENILE